MATRRTSTAPYRCTECGWTALKWVGRCGECQQWGTVVEAAEQTGINRSVTAVSPAPDRAARPITAIDTRDAPRRTTGVGEFDRVLGGGVVAGQVVLIGGDPGIGKSTLLLQALDELSRNMKTLYVTGEESGAQVALRSRRLGLGGSQVRVLAEIQLEKISATLDQEQPAVCVIDSIQTMYS
ncbi:MAG: ATPase domain-containing protein, partial [Myxococcota bacterium]